MVDLYVLEEVEVHLVVACWEELHEVVGELEVVEDKAGKDNRLLLLFGSLDCTHMELVGTWYGHIVQCHNSLFGCE